MNQTFTRKISTFFLVIFVLTICTTISYGQTCNPPCEADQTCVFVGNGPNPPAICIPNVSPLAVNLVDFKVVFSSSSSKLLWVTSVEENNKGFEIEHSIDGQRWNKLGFVDGNGSTEDVSRYEFLDRFPVNGANYYRLKQIDFDGRFEYSEIIVGEMDGEKAEIFQVFPNPSNGDVTLRLDNPEDLEVSISLFDATGKLIWENNLNSSDSRTFWQNDFNLPQHGIYYFVARIGNEIQTKKLTVLK